ncbi:hypothetical protein Sdia_12960 [Streptomyces diastaticus subsp. diastaticus]|uniref:Uncharacterized protein n=1 Tax=Streptomyces diastaticus subsp. diastaticus TaxID=68040 RepID=A0ABQ1CK65_STRDI|nr:hypothetical protein Sdia_12960 [Streptomyces diastaticus subsp. diastaticus]GGU35085.1 hypothetical protein GCM10015534_42210 [Streptomyces diastaticus subsp. diastaticus]
MGPQARGINTPRGAMPIRPDQRRGKHVDAALAGLVGTVAGALAGAFGSWLAQRAQLRLQRESLAHQESIRWVDDKWTLHRDLLIALRNWRDCLMHLWQEGNREGLHDARATAYRLGVGAGLIAQPGTRIAIKEARKGLLAGQAAMARQQVPQDATDPCSEAKPLLTALEEALHVEPSWADRSAAAEP